MRHHRATAEERIVRAALGIASVISVATLLGIVGFLAAQGLRFFAAVPPGEFFLGTDWNPTSYERPSWGILPLAASTGIVAAAAAAIAIPVGLSAAIYLSEIASPTIRETFKPLIEMIAGIPSVVLGIVGVLYLAPLVARTFGMPSGLTGLSAALLVALSAVPTVASVAEDALSAVPKRLREASLALGATKWETIRSVVLPAAKSGVAAAAMLGIGRIVGETVIVLMVAGNSRALPGSLLDPVRPITSTIAIEIKETIASSLHSQGLFALGLVMLLATLVINVAVSRLTARA